MKIDFRIPVFHIVDGILQKKYDKEFLIQFLPAQHIRKFRVCVDGNLTTKTINAFDFSSKKPIFLEAIREVLETKKVLDRPNPKKFLTLEKMNVFYAKSIIRQFKINVLESCQTEQKRDNLILYNLIFIEE